MEKDIRNITPANKFEGKELISANGRTRNLLNMIPAVLDIHYGMSSYS